MHIQWTICLISNISGHYGSYSSRSGLYTHEQGGGGVGGGGKRPFQRAFKSFLRKKSQYTVTCTYQATVHFKLNPHVSAQNTHTGIKKFSLFHHKGGLYRDLMRDLSGSLLTNTNLVIPWNPKQFVGWQGSPITNQWQKQRQLQSWHTNCLRICHAARCRDGNFSLTPWHMGYALPFEEHKMDRNSLERVGNGRHISPVLMFAGWLLGDA